MKPAAREKKRDGNQCKRAPNVVVIPGER
jgi:hypothetical protein